MKRSMLFLGFPILLLAAAQPASAQMYSLGQKLQRTGKSAEFTPDKLSFFSFFKYGYADYDTTYEVTRDAHESRPPLSEDVTYKASTTRLRLMTPQVGMTYTLTPKLLLSMSIGVSLIELERRTNKIPAQLSWYNNQHQMLFQYDLEPGLASSLGVLFQPVSFSDFFAVVGLHIYYTSAYHLESDEVDGVQVQQNDVSISMLEARTRDVNLHLLEAVAHAGMEWRPYRMFLSNNFGLLLSYGMSFGALQKEYSHDHTTNNQTQSVWEEDTVKFNMTPASLVGVYYGWSLFLPYFGTFGVEARAINSWNICANYEYTF